MIKRQFFCIVFFSILASLANAGLFDQLSPAKDPLDVEKAFIFDYSEQDNQLKLVWKIADKYYLYQDKIILKAGNKTQIVSQEFTPAEEKNDPAFGKVSVYHDQAEVVVNLTTSDSKPVDDLLVISYQGCWEGGICYPPVEKEIRVSGIIQTTATKSEVTTNNSNPEILTEQDYFTGLLQQGNIALIIGAFFIAGLALALTPCVFPMIPILSSIIAGEGDNSSTKRGFMLSLVYVLAVSCTYTIAGILAGIFGENLQIWFQNPWAISLFSLIFVLLALSMFGLYELQMPASLQTWLSNLSRKQQRGTVIGTVIMGFLSALIVGPCMAAPLAGALAYIGQQANPVLGGIALFSLSLGMGIPLLIAGTSAGRFLPRAGEWMNSVKASFGVMLLLLAIWMLARIIPATITLWLVAIVLLISSLYMGALSKYSADCSKPRLMIKGIGLIIFIYSASLLLGALAGSKSLFYPLNVYKSQGQQLSLLQFKSVTNLEQLQAHLLAAKQQQKPAMLDFYADWCIACKELEETLGQPEIQQVLADYSLIKVDITANDAAAKAMSKKYAVLGPPALIFYNSSGQLLKNNKVVGTLTSTRLLAYLAAVN